MDKIEIINEYTLLKNYQKTNSNTATRPFESLYQSIINPEFLIFKNNKYYKYSQSQFEEIPTEKVIPTTSSISFNNFNIFYVKNNGETHTVINENNLTYETLTLKGAIRLTGNLSKKYIVKVSCGDSHALFLTHAGMLFSIGDNNLGQLGLGENEKIKEIGEAVMIKDLLNYRIIDISTGNNHCVCFGIIRDLSKQNKENSSKNDINKDNIIFTWGDNSFGQCGINDSDVKFINTPTKVLVNDKEIVNEGIKIISTGLNFTVLLLNNGKVFGFGDNQFHQLDLYSDNKKIYKVQELNFDYINSKKAKIINLITSSFSLLIITDGKFLYGMGKYSGLNNEGRIIEIENNIDKGIKVVLNDNKIIFFYYMINAEKKIVKEVKIDKKNVIKNRNSPPKKKISMPKLTNKDNNTINNTVNSTPTKQRNSLKIKNNDRYSTTSSNEGTNVTNNTNSNDTNSASGRSNISNPSSHNNTNGNNNNSSSNLTSVIGNYLNNNTNEKINNNSKTPNINQRQNLDLKSNNSKNDLNIQKTEPKINNNTNTIKSMIPSNQKQEINKKNENLKSQNNQNPISNTQKINKSNSIVISNSNKLNNENEKEKKILKSNSQINLPQIQNTNQTKNPLSNTQIQNASTFKNIFNAPKIFNYEEDDNPNNKSVLSDIGGFFSNQFSSIRKSFFKRRDITKENYFNDFCNNIFIFSQYKNQIKKNFYSGISDKLRGKVWLKCLGNKFSITEDYFKIELEKAEKLKIPIEIKNKINLPFKYLGLFKENSPLTEDFYDIISAFVSSRPDIGIQEDISYLTGILLINMRKFQTYVSLLNILLSPNIICYYLNNNEIIRKNCQLFKQIFLFNLPDLCSFFELNNILPEDYFVIWNKTIFSKCFNIDIVMRIWDIYMIEGPRAIFEASCALLYVLYREIMEADDKDSILDILLHSQEKELNEEKIIQTMSKIKFPMWIKDEVKKMGEYLLPLEY